MAGRPTARASRAERRTAVTGVLREAVESLLEDGRTTFTELSVATISAAAGISRPTFYAYFDDKTDLVRALATDAIDELVEASGRWLELPPTAARDDVRAAMAGVFAAYGRHRLVIAAVVEVAALDAPLRALLAEVVDGAAARAAGHIRAGQARGEVRAGLDPDTAARWLAWMTERGLRRAHASGPTASPAAVRTMADIHWLTLYEGIR